MLSELKLVLLKCSANTAFAQTSSSCVRALPVSDSINVYVRVPLQRQALASGGDLEGTVWWSLLPSATSGANGLTRLLS